ncbi:MAG TPA: DUF3291 domain-containing protein [Edaphobacter sp.]|nr:DUF3291 domain-containing protein [Edaphobacter sp.]
MPDHHLAQINIARLLHPIDDPRIADFVRELDPINALAEQSPGFIWRLKSPEGNATDIAYSEDPFVIVNMSVWVSLDTLKDYIYRSRHLEIFKQRRSWFEKMDKPHYCLWWIPAGHAPTVTEGRQRLEHYQLHGSTPHSFWFSEPYPVQVLAQSKA